MADTPDVTDTTAAPEEPRRVLPRFPEPDTEPFWEATKEHELRFQVCDACEGVVFYPRAHCTHCTSTELSWRTSAGTGTIYSFSVVRRSLHPSFLDLVPYVVSWVDVDEGFRLMTHIVDVDPDDPHSGLEIGARVIVSWIDRGTVNLPGFRIDR
ncbi:MAG: Zn-ribbon domain-containing OB-fold protein [Acidimicrobiales bacterium]|nr:Zn-ribbon domain-containing OB-fold protein [Acidimicrobiales bacterium]